MKTQQTKSDWETVINDFFDFDIKDCVVNYLPIFSVGGSNKVTHTINGFAVYMTKNESICWKVSDGNLDVKYISC